MVALHVLCLTGAASLFSRTCIFLSRQADLDPDLPSLLKTLKEDWAPCGVMPNRLSQAVVDYFAPRLFRRMDRITGVLRRKAEVR